MAGIPFQNNPSRIKLYDFLKESSLSVPVGSMVLDAGAGEGMYKDLFGKMNYISIDLGKISKTYGDISAISNLTKIPFSTGQFDLIVCTQVLEHVEDPRTVLAEMWRVLKPRASLWISVPFFYEQHEIPHDYYRYTTFGLKYLLETANFHVRRLQWLEGYYGTLAYQLATAVRFFRVNEKNYLLAFLFKLLAYRFTNAEKSSNKVIIDQQFLYGKNLIAVAVKYGC